MFLEQNSVFGVVEARAGFKTEIITAMRRVVVTGLGIVSPIGVGKEAFWSACREGKSGVGPIRSFDASGHPVQIAAEVNGFDVTPYLPANQRKSIKVMSRAMQFAVGAASWLWMTAVWN